MDNLTVFVYNGWIYVAQDQLTIDASRIYQEIQRAMNQAMTNEGMSVSDLHHENILNEESFYRRKCPVR